MSVPKESRIEAILFNILVCLINRPHAFLVYCIWIQIMNTTVFYNKKIAKNVPFGKLTKVGKSEI